MKLKAISATVMGLALGTAIAAPATGAQPSPAFAQQKIIFGNSVLPQMQANLSKDQSIYFGGLANADFLYTTTSDYNGAASSFAPNTNSEQFQISNANVFVGGNYGWAHGVVNLGYFAADSWNRTGDTNAPPFNPGVLNQAAGADVGLDEAYINLYNPASSGSMPYMRIGKFYSAYGQYNPYTQFPSLTDLMEGMNATGVELGYILNTGGMTFFANGSAVSGVNTSQVLKAAAAVVGQHKVNNFTANAGMQASFGSVDVSFGGGWLDNAYDLMYMGQATNATKYEGHAYNAYLGLRMMQDITLKFKYAMLSGDYTAAAGAAANTVDTKSPYAMTVDGGYHFQVMGKRSKLGVTFGMSADASNGTGAAVAAAGATGLAMPKYQFGASYDLHVNSYLTAGATFIHSMDYAKGTAAADGGTGNKNNMFGLRMGVNF